MSNLIKKFLVRGWDYYMKKNLKRKIRLYGNYKTKYSWNNFERLNDHRELFRCMNVKINTVWYKYFTLVRQKEDPRYLPEDIWHVDMEPVLNNRSYSKTNNDKNLFHKAEYAGLFPTAFLHCIEGVYYNNSFFQIDLENAFKLIPDNTEIVVKKALDTGGGKGVMFFHSKEDMNLEKTKTQFNNNFVIQEKVRQHPWFARFNPDSINTIRVITYRSVKNEKVHVLQTLLRMGKKGSQVDNQSSGGIACGIDDSGKLNSWGCDKLSNRFYEVNGFKFSEIDRIPCFEKLKNICIDIASGKFYERVLVFDTWRDTNNNIRLLEINNINIGIEDLQKNNGPLFGDFTNEVLEFCSKNKRTFCFDFES